MQKLLSLAIAAALVLGATGNAVAQTSGGASSGGVGDPGATVEQSDAAVNPLPAGQAAGVSTAPLVAGGTLLAVAGVAVVATAIALAVSNGHHSSTSTTTTSGR